MLVSFLPAAFARLRRSRSAAAVAVLALLAVAPRPAAAQTRVIDHAAFDSLLHRHVRDGMVDYDAMEAAPEFARYLTRLASTDLAGVSERERLAFWINTYNAYTIALIVNHHERESIRNINRSLGFLHLKGPWRENLVHAAGRTLSLDNVEHDIIRRDFHEPRIHFALVCAAMGCPPLRSEAYTGARLDAQLDEQARLFLLRSPAKNRVDVPARVFHASLIFDLYKDDFGGTNAAVGKFVAPYLPEGPERRLLESGSFDLAKTSYDWTLNSQEQAKRRAEAPR